MAGLQAAQELPGFLLHEELVFGAPTGHRLPGTGHLRGSERVSSVQTQVVLTSKSGDVSRTLPLDAGSQPVLLPFSWRTQGSHAASLGF